MLTPMGVSQRKSNFTPKNARAAFFPLSISVLFLIIRYYEIYSKKSEFSQNMRKHRAALRRVPFILCILSKFYFIE